MSGRIRFRTRCAGPDGVFHPEDVADHPQAQALVAAGAAEWVHPPAPVIEEATAPPAPEQAVARKRRQR